MSDNDFNALLMRHQRLKTDNLVIIVTPLLSSTQAERTQRGVNKTQALVCPESSLTSTIQSITRY